MKSAVRVFLTVAVAVALVVAVGLAVPKINLNVQEIGASSCDVQSPVRWANLELVWSKSGGIVETWTLTGINVYFSNPLPKGTEIRLLLIITGYHQWTDSSPSTDKISNFTVLASNLTSGDVITLSPNGTYSYQVFSLFGVSPPKVDNVTMIIVDGASKCSSNIILFVQNIGIGSTSYTPPPIELPQINITINNTGNPELRNYVVNFTISPTCIPNLSKVYVTDSSGKLLYFWAFNDSANSKVWFWVNYTVPANSTSNIIIHLNGTGMSSYFNPRKVFWYFNDTPLQLQARFFSGADVYIVNYSVSNFFSANYNGYAIDTNATLAKPTSFLGTVYPNRIGPYFISFYYSGYYLGIGATGNSSLYPVYGTSLTRVNNAGNTLGSLPSWGPGVYSIINYFHEANYYTQLYFEAENLFTGQWTSGVYMLTKFVLGQKYGGPSIYSWIGMRPVFYPFPQIVVPESCGTPAGGGDYTFTIYFRP